MSFKTVCTDAFKKDMLESVLKRLEDGDLKANEIHVSRFAIDFLFDGISLLTILLDDKPLIWKIKEGESFIRLPLEVKEKESEEENGI